MHRTPCDSGDGRFQARAIPALWRSMLMKCCFFTSWLIYVVYVGNNNGCYTRSLLVDPFGLWEVTMFGGGLHLNLRLFVRRGRLWSLKTFRKKMRFNLDPRALHVAVLLLVGIRKWRKNLLPTPRIFKMWRCIVVQNVSMPDDQL